MIYEPSYIYPNVLNSQGERCFYTMQDNTFRILVNSDYPITSVTYTIYNPDNSVEFIDTLSGLNFYTNTVNGEQNILEFPNVSLQNGSGKIDISGDEEINPNVFSDTIWTYILEFTDSQGNTYTTKKYAFYITPSPVFVSISGQTERALEITSRSHTFQGVFTYATQPISWIKWSVYLNSIEGQVVYSTDKIYRSVPLDFYFDGFDSHTTYYIVFEASDTRGNESQAVQEVYVNYDYSDQFDAIETRIMPDSSILVDWSSLQGIEGTPVNITIEDEDSHYLENTPVEDHYSLHLPEGYVSFKGSNNIDLNIPEDDTILWSGKIYDNMNDILVAVDDQNREMSLSFEGYEVLYPSSELYPSDTLFPPSKGKFRYTKTNGETLYWQSWSPELDITNSWFVVRLTPTSINVYATRWEDTNEL